MLKRLICSWLQEDTVQRHAHASLASCQALGQIHERIFQWILRKAVGYPGPDLVLSENLCRRPFFVHLKVDEHNSG